MKLLKLRPDQIVTTKDFPVYNEQVLKIYYKICKDGHPEILPPCPVLHISTGLPLLEERTEAAKKHNSAIKQYFVQHPDVEYILLDGSHKTTALTLTGNPINVYVVEKDEDIRELERMEQTGDIISFASGGIKTVDGLLKDMAEHHSKDNRFETVEEKTQRMKKEKVIPEYMIKY